MPNDYTCKGCGADVDYLSIFPGTLCLPCYTPIGERKAATMTADKLTRMWGGTVLAITAAAVILATTGTAHADQLETADRNVDTVRVSYVEPVGARKLYVELNNGATYRLNPCGVEDGRHCYWDADTAGNGRGSSFVRVSGRLIFSALVGGAR